MNEVLITGLGPISSVGIGREDFFRGLTEGRAGVRPLERVVPAGLEAVRAAECLDFVVEDYLETEKTYLDRASELALAACHLALLDARIERSALDQDRVGLSLGTAYGCLDSMLAHTRRLNKKGARFTSPVVFQHSYANTPTSLCAIEYDVRGPASTCSDGWISGATAIQYAFDVLRDGRADVMLAGGFEALSVPLLQALQASGMLEGTEAIIPGEGAGVLLLETEQHARARGVQVLGALQACEVAWDPNPIEAVERARRAVGEVARIIACTDGVGKEQGAIETTARLGQTFGASVGLGVCWACHGGGSSHVVAWDQEGGGCCLAVQASGK